MLRLLKLLLLVLTAHICFGQVPRAISFAPNGTYSKDRGRIEDSILRTPVLNLWYSLYNSQDSTGLMWYWPNQNAFAGKWGTITRLFASQDWVQQRVIDSMQNLQSVLTKGNTTTSDLIFNNNTGGSRLTWNQFSDYANIRFTSTNDDNNSSNLVFTVGDNIDASSIDRFIFQRDRGATGGISQILDTIVEMSVTNGVRSRRNITTDQNFTATGNAVIGGNLTINGTTTATGAISTAGNISGMVVSGNNGLVLIKDGSASGALTGVRLLNAAQNRGFNIQLAGNTTSAISLYTLNGVTWNRRIDIDSVGNVGINASTPNSTLTVNGTISNPNIATYSGNVTLANEYYVNINNTANAVVTLPNPSTMAGREYVITKVSNNAFTVNITPSSGQIVFTSTYVVPSAGIGVTVWTDGLNWWVK